jgi:amphi-Trp domain-containing protein
VPNVEIKRKVRLTRQEAAERLIALGNALAGGSEVDLSSDGASIKLGVAGHVDWELEIEVDGDETELEIEIKWKDDPDTDDSADDPADHADAGSPIAQSAAEPEAATPAQARRGRPRKAAAT